jgi:hypothetical protein
LSALVGLQELSLANFDQTLEDMVPEDLLIDGGMMEVCVDMSDVGLESSRAASRASSTLERGLKSQEADLNCFVSMEVVENPSALEVATTENLFPKDALAFTQLLRVLPVMIRLGWAARAMTQPPRVSERVPPLIPPWMSILGLLLHILISWQQHVLWVRKSP